MDKLTWIAGPSRLAMAIGLALALGGPACGGTIRYELSNLLGEHRYDGEDSLWSAIQQIDTPFGFYGVKEARLVIEGTVLPGMGRGDGVLREPTSFVLPPSVGVRPSFETSSYTDNEPTSEMFRIEKVYADPFVPETTPLPNPDGYPPVSFSVSLSVGPIFAPPYPPWIDPNGGHLFNWEGVIIDEPIVATIHQAYILLSGPAVVPEPGSIALVGGLVVLLVGARRYAKRSAGRNFLGGG